MPTPPHPSRRDVLVALSVVGFSGAAVGVAACTSQRSAEPTPMPAASGGGSAADDVRGHDAWLAHRRALDESVRLKQMSAVRVLTANVAALAQTFASGATATTTPSALAPAGVAALAGVVETLADSTQMASVGAVDPQVAGTLAAVAAGDAALAVALREQS